MKTVSYAVEDGIAIITLDNPDERMNLVSPDFIADMTAAVARLRDDAEAKGAIIVSGKPAFMAGADLKVIGDLQARAISTQEAVDFAIAPSDMHRAMETCGKPIVAAIGGLALGGGYELALACHRRIVVDEPGAVVGLPEVTLGLLPGSGGIQRLGRMVGTKVALEVLLGGRPFAPAKALALGLVDAVVPRDGLIEAAREWIDSGPDPVRDWDRKGWRPAEWGGLLDVNTANLHTFTAAATSAKTHHKDPAPIVIQQCLFEGLQQPFDRAQRLENKYFAKLLTGPVSRAIVRTMFLNKGANDALVMRPDGFEKQAVGKVGVLGAGMMGAGIAHVSAIAGIDVVLIDMDQAAADRGKAASAKILAKAVERGKMTQDAADGVLARINATTDYAPLGDVDLVVEAVFEKSEVKADVTARAAAAMSDTALFASNTSTLPITALAKNFPRPADFIGLHFFSPVDRMPLVEVIMGQATSQGALARALDYVKQIRKTPIVVNDSRGFYTSRVFQTFIHEGMAMVAEGVHPALIENAAKQAGFPVGPLQLCDEVTLALPRMICEQAMAEEGDAYTVPVSYPVLVKMIDELGRPGRKDGGGFYDYTEDGSRSLWPGLADAYPLLDKQPDVEEVKTRLLYIQSLETARCLDEGVLTRPEDGDIGAVLGWAFPTWTGGTMSLIDSVGAAEFVATCDRLAQAYGARFLPTDNLRARVGHASQPEMASA